MKTIQLGQVEGVKNTTGPVRKKKNFDKKITARTEARILGTTEWATMTTRDSVEYRRAKGKARKAQARDLVNNFRAIATHVARGVTKQLTASHRAKEKMEQDGIKATKAKDQAKVEQRDSPKAKAKE